MVYSLYFLSDSFLCQFFGLQSGTVTFHCIMVCNNHHHPYIGSLLCCLIKEVGEGKLMDVQGLLKSVREVRHDFLD